LIVLGIGYQYLLKGTCGVFHDDAIYVITAKALSEGKGYRLINLPESPLQTKYPFLYPGLLALIWRATPNFSQNIFSMKIITLLTGALAIGLCYFYMIRFMHCHRFIAFSSCLLCSTTPWFLFFATNTLSEMFFLLLLLLSLWALEGKSRNPFTSRKRDFVIGILVSLPFLCRNIGAACIISSIIICYWRKIPFRWVILGSLTIVLPWLLWVLYSMLFSIYNPVQEYYVDYIGWWHRFGYYSMASIFFINIFIFLYGVNRLIFSGIYYIFFPFDFNWTFFIYLLFMAFIFFLYCVRNIRNPGFLFLFIISYIGIILFWPWPPDRFIIIILPFLIGHLVLGIDTIFERLGFKNIFRAAGAVIMIILVTTNLFIVYQNIEDQKRTGYPQIISQASMEDSVYWASYEDIFNWVKEHSSPNDVIASGLDSMVYLYTGRQSFRPYVANFISVFYNGNYPAVGTVDEFHRILATYKPKYLIDTPMPGFPEEKYFHTLLQHFLNRYPNALRPVYMGQDTRFKIYEINFH
jgi:hypothetical protein